MGQTWLKVSQAQLWPMTGRGICWNSYGAETLAVYWGSQRLHKEPYVLCDDYSDRLMTASQGQIETARARGSGEVSTKQSHIYAHVHKQTCRHIYVLQHTFIHMYKYTYKYLHIYTSVHMHTHVHTLV